MKEFYRDLKYKAVCRRKRNQMIKTYLGGVYFQFDSDNHVQYCLKCQTAGKRYRAFREELENEVQVEVEVPDDFTSRVMSSLDKKVKTTTIGPIRLSKDSFRENWLQKIEKLGRKNW